MLARLKNVFFPPPIPSAVLAVDNLDGMIHFFHIVPEDGTIETLGFTSFSPTFRLYGTTEQAREQIGTVTLEAEGPFTFLNAVATRASKSWDCSPLSSPAQEQTDNVEAATQLAPDSLHRAAADAIPNQNEQACSVSATWRAGNAEVVTQLVEVLRQAALDVIRDGEEHPQLSLYRGGADVPGLHRSCQSPEAWEDYPRRADKLSAILAVFTPHWPIGHTADDPIALPSPSLRLP